VNQALSGIRSGYRALFMVAVSVGTLLLALDAFGAFGLKRVTLDGELIPLEDSRALGLAPGSSVFQQRLDVTANMMCRRAGIGAAQVEIVSAHAVDIRTNQFESMFLVYDARSKRLRGLTSNLVVAPLDNNKLTGKELESAPMFVGLAGIKLFERPTDFRLETIVADLRRLCDEDERLFVTLSAIDCSREDYLTVSFRNTDVVLKADALTFGEAIARFQTVITSASDITSETAVVDMRFDGLMIIPQTTGSSYNTQESRRRGNG
jgi:hypothetical protein